MKNSHQNIVFDWLGVPYYRFNIFKDDFVYSTLSRIVTTLGKFEVIEPDVSITRNIVTEKSLLELQVYTENIWSLKSFCMSC